MRRLAIVSLVWLGAGGLPSITAAQDGVTRYVRYVYEARTSWGVLDGQTVWEIGGRPWETTAHTGASVPRDRVRLLAPAEPSKIVAVGLNYQSHLGDREPAQYPGLFAKYPTSIAGPGDTIVIPADGRNLHYEGELVLVIGRRAKNVPVAEAMRYVFGVTAGNDLSERDWQANDLQWLRAKASDRFAPVGPVVATGLDYGNLVVTTRVNGEVRQSESTADLLFDLPTLVSYISRYVTLDPGDLIFTGTPGTTRALAPGDVVEVEVEGVGAVRNVMVGAGPGMD